MKYIKDFVFFYIYISSNYATDIHTITSKLLKKVMEDLIDIYSNKKYLILCVNAIKMRNLSLSTRSHM